MKGVELRGHVLRRKPWGFRILETRPNRHRRNRPFQGRLPIKLSGSE